jgi:hypothetical protein
MFAYLVEMIDNWLEHAEQRRLDDYFATSPDLGELERRMCSVERNGHTA